MSNFTYIITPEQITWLDDYDNAKTLSIIRDVQLSDIRSIFPNYYEYLIQAIENKDLKKGDEKVIDEYLTPMMSLLCENDLHTKSMLKIGTVGTRIEVSVEYDQASSSKIQAVVTLNQQKISTYRIELLNFMSARVIIFPDFEEDDNCNTGTDVEETFMMSTVKPFYRQSTIYGRRRRSIIYRR